MILRMMRGRRAGAPSPVARLVAVLVVAGMLVLAAPVLGPLLVVALRWLSGLL